MQATRAWSGGLDMSIRFGAFAGRGAERDLIAYADYS
jgi:hypothetical protein